MTDESDGIRREYNGGAAWANHIKAGMPGFIENHRARIFEFRRKYVDSLVKGCQRDAVLGEEEKLALSVHLYILCVTRGIGAKTDATCQNEDLVVAKYLWSEKKRRELTMDEVLHIWLEGPCKGWRSKHALRCCYVFHRNKDELIRLLMSK